MTLEQLEIEMDVKFPNRFHEIYNTGAMEWLTVEREVFLSKRNQFLNNPKSFMFLSCMCEPIPFADISIWNTELKERLQAWEEIENVHLKQDIKLVPFGQSCGGDIYCFLYQNEVEEPMVIQIWHDTFDPPSIEGRDFDEFMYYQLLDSLQSDDTDTNDAAFLAHMEFLQPQYVEKIIGKDKNILLDEYYKLQIAEFDIMNSYY